MTTNSFVAASAPAAPAAEATAAADAFSELLAAGDAKALAAFFQNKTEKERRTCVKPLREFLTTVGWRASRDADWYDYNDRWTRARRTVTPAALAVFPTAATTAKFLRGAQRANVFDIEDMAVVKQILADRAPEWLADLPSALLATLAPESTYRLVAAAREVAHVPVAPTTEFVRAWSGEYRWNHSFDQLKMSILTDPWLAEVAPLVFDDEENDYLFTSWAVFRKAVISAMEEGLVAREAIVDASLRRLLRGGRPGAIQDHLAFWTSLEATDAELVERVSSCISLLSSQSGSVARSFLVALKKASGAGLLDLDLAVEAASIAVTRPEKNVVKTSLSWLDALTVAHPDRAGQLVGTIAIAFGAQAADLQERAVKLVGKHAKKLDPAEHGRLVAEGQVYLPADLAATLAGLLGVSVSADPSADDAAYPDVAPYVPRPLLPPIAGPAMLAESIAVLMQGDPLEAMAFERVLEAFVEFARTDAAGLKEALEPIVERWQGVDWEGDQIVMTPRRAIASLAVAAAGIGAERRRFPHRAGVNQLWSRVRKSGRSWWHRTRTSPADFLTLRAVEVAAAFGMPDLPPLVSIPTSPSGWIEPGVLAARLRECEARGWVPLQADLHQALLRLPEDCGERGVDVSGFTSKAGRRFAAWMSREDRVALPDAQMPDPAAWRDENRDRRSTYMRSRTGAHVKDPSTLLNLVQGVWSEPERCWDQSDWAVCWPAIVPSRPDLAAVAMIGGSDWSSASASVESAVVLAEQDGPQTATHHVIAARLTDDDARLRASGVDAALVLAARGLLDPAELSAALAPQLAVAGGGLRRLVPGLRDLANGGAARQTWETVAALFPAVLPPAVPKTLSGTADLLVLGTELAGGLGVRTPIAEVSVLAAKKSGGTVTKAARRLEAALTAG